MKYEVGPYRKPGRPLLAKPVKRVTPKSEFLLSIERRQQPVQRFAAPSPEMLAMRGDQ